MKITTKEVFSFRTLVQKIRNAFIRTTREQKPNWFHILTWRLAMLNPFRKQYEKISYWRWVGHFFYSYYLESYMEWLRYRTDLAFRLDKKIEKVMKEYVAKTDWTHSYELECDNEYGSYYEYTLVYCVEKQSEADENEWIRELKEKIFDIAESERCWLLSCAYLNNFMDKRIGETYIKGRRKIHFCNGGIDE